MEEWKVIEEANKYMISSHGRVKSFRGDKVNGKIIKAFTNKKGYHRILLYSHENKQIMRRVHRLVALAFIDNHCDEKDQVDHIDNDKDNNYVSNLRWCDNRQNNTYKSKKEYVGVSLVNGRFASSIYIDGKNVYIGSFGDEKSAGLAYLDVLNNIDEYPRIISKYRKHKIK